MIKNGVNKQFPVEISMDLKLISNNILNNVPQRKENVCAKSHNPKIIYRQ
jgi:hypothetical protein